MTGERLAWFRVAAHLGKTVEELAERITYREFLNWLEYLRWDESRGKLSHYYLAQIAAEVQKSVLASKDAKKVKLQDYVLKMTDEKPAQDTKTKQGSKASWLGLLGIDASKN